MVNKFFLYFNTMKYLKLSQFYYRGSFIFKKKFFYKSKKMSELLISKASQEAIDIQEKAIKFNSIDSSTISFKKIEIIEEKRRKLENKEFTFLNKTHVFINEVEWNHKNLSQLWKYNLNYFDYLQSLIEYESLFPNNANYMLLKEYIVSWINNNTKVGQGDGWHSYTISLRLTNWVYSYSIFNDYIKSDNRFKVQFKKSIYLQYQFLLKNLEYDVRGNHLFENLKALLIAGMFLNTKDFKYNQKKIIEDKMSQQLTEQFLKDGGHFELSAMYHCIVLKGLSDLIYIYDRLGYEVPTTFIQVQKNALEFLKNIIHPDGEIPLFNDAAFKIANLPSLIFAYTSVDAEEKTELSVFDQLIKTDLLAKIDVHYDKKSFFGETSGYLRTSDEILFSVIDFGKPSPDYLPAHAHADIFSYEISVKEKRFVVDSGTFEYAGEKRDLDRATYSHNTLTINRENQSQVWGSFRLAKRATPKVSYFKNSKESIELIAFHNGYLQRFGVLHYRKYIHVFGEALIIVDFVEGLKNEKLESFIHFAPEIAFKITTDGIIFDNEDVILKSINSVFQVENSVYHPEFGVEKLNKKVTVTPISNGPFGYYYSYGEKKVEVRNRVISIGNKNYDFRMEPE